MHRTLLAAAVTVGMAITATSAAAVSVLPFGTPLSAGDSTLGNAVATPFEDFSNTELSFTAATDLVADITITINPYLVSPSGIPSNSIALNYAINGGSLNMLPITDVSLPSGGSVGAAGISLLLSAGDVTSFFIDGSAGQSGNQVTFAIETVGQGGPSPIPVPASGLMLITGAGVLAAARRRRKS